MLNDLVDRLQEVSAAFHRSVEAMSAAADIFTAGREAIGEGMEAADSVGDSHAETAVVEPVEEGVRAVDAREGVVETTAVAEGNSETLAQVEGSTAWMGGVCWRSLLRGTGLGRGCGLGRSLGGLWGR